MENPATWGKAEHVISDAYGEYHIAQNRGVIGASLVRCIADALRKHGLLIENEKITRFEVIDHSVPIGEGFKGRVLVRHNTKIELAVQDDGRTLKVFISE